MSSQRRVRAATGALLLLAAGAAGPRAHAGGASPYLPLNLSPEIERQIEQVLILGDQAVQTRPVPVARVLSALPKACERDARLCARVRRYLDRYFRTVGVTEASAELAATGKSSVQLPNAHGQRVDSPWDASATAAYRPFDHLLITAGGLAYGGPGGRFEPDGTMVSLGDQYLQLDAGWRDQWLSPATDSSMLLSTEAPTMPSFTLSSQMPFSRLGLEYQFSIARMSYSNDIAWNNGFTAGDPRLATLHVGIAPLPGWSFAGNLLLQYGGGARSSSLTGLFDFLFTRTSLGPTGTALDSRFANREVSLTSTYTFPGATPFETYVEYGGRDTLHGELYRFHETSLTAGIHIPELFKRYDLTVEASEWQNGWYTDYVWQSGMVNDGSVIGAWGAAWRDFPNNAGARSAMAQLGFTLPSEDLVNLRYRVLQNAGYASECLLCAPLQSYSLAQMLTLEYAQPRNGYTRGLTLDVGRDEYDAGFVRLAAFLRLDGGRPSADEQEQDEDDEDQQDSGEQGAGMPARLERFVDVGVGGVQRALELGGFSAAAEAAQPQTVDVVSPHLGVGVRRAVTARADFGVRADLDDFKGLMVGLRILDYRYRLGRHLAAGGFLGFARYSGPTPAQGYYYGIGLQWRDLWHHWDLSLDERYFDALQRDKVLPSDQAALRNGDPVEWYMMQGPTLYASHAF